MFTTAYDLKEGVVLTLRKFRFSEDVRAKQNKFSDRQITLELETKIQLVIDLANNPKTPPTTLRLVARMAGALTFMDPGVYLTAAATPADAAMPSPEHAWFLLWNLLDPVARDQYLPTDEFAHAALDELALTLRMPLALNPNTPPWVLLWLNEQEMGKYQRWIEQNAVYPMLRLESPLLTTVEERRLYLESQSPTFQMVEGQMVHYMWSSFEKQKERAVSLLPGVYWVGQNPVMMRSHTVCDRGDFPVHIRTPL